ncbi:MAG: alpha/beta hydrolase [bacterium]|nr:alpha/beta hydrolase [bacterium]
MIPLEKHSALLPLGQWHWFEGGQGPALVLLPGFGDSKKTFVRLGRLLAQHFRVLLPDTPGFGDCEPMTPDQYALSLQVARLHQWVEHLGLESPWVGGNSSGGQIACLYGLTYPTETAGLILLAPQGMADAEFKPYSHKPQAPQSGEDFEAVLKALYYQPPQMSQTQLAELAERSAAKWDFLNQIRAVIRSEPAHQLNRLLTPLSCPTLVLWGQQDGRIPARLAALWEAASPKVKLELLEHCGHLPQLEQTEATAAAICHFAGST